MFTLSLGIPSPGGINLYLPALTTTRHKYSTMRKLTHMPINNFRATDPKTIPEPWHNAMQKNGFVDPRNGEPSLRALSRATTLHTTTIANVIYGRTKAKLETIQELANAFEVESSVVAEWLGQRWTYGAPWTPPAESFLMTPAQRVIIEDAIREFAKKNN